MTPRLFAVALTGLVSLVGLGALASSAHAGAADVTVGALRAPTSRAGAALRPEARMSAKPLGNVPHGTRLMVEAVDGKWIRTTAKLADGTSAQGWMKADDTVEPFALTGAGRSPGVEGGTTSRGGAGAVSAAARGFGPGIEAQAALSDAKLAAGLRLVDRIEAATPTPEEVSAFSKQGRLGFPGKTR